MLEFKLKELAQAPSPNSVRVGGMSAESFDAANFRADKVLTLCRNVTC